MLMKRDLICQICVRNADPGAHVHLPNSQHRYMCAILIFFLSVMLDFNLGTNARNVTGSEYAKNDCRIEFLNKLKNISFLGMLIHAP